MMRALLLLVLAVGLAGCAGFTEPLGMEDPFAIPQPFRGVERNDEMIAQAIEVPALVIEVPQGLSAEVGTALRDQVVEAARKHDIPALSAPTPMAWVLTASAAIVATSAPSDAKPDDAKAGKKTRGKKAAAKVEAAKPASQTVILWRLADATGVERTQFPVTFAGTEEALSLGGTALLAEQTAAALETALTHPRRQVAANPASTERPVAWIGAIKGAPGDGNTALARAMVGVLPLKGVKVDPAKDKAKWRIEGIVSVKHGAGDRDVVTLTWRVLDDKGKEAGTIAQENAVPRGRLNKPWAEIAGFAAEAAAEGIAQLLQQIGQAQPS
jgi:hypothetical protein